MNDDEAIRAWSGESSKGKFNSREIENHLKMQLFLLRELYIGMLLVSSKQIILLKPKSINNELEQNFDYSLSLFDQIIENDSLANHHFRTSSGSRVQVLHL